MSSPKKKVNNNNLNITNKKKNKSNKKNKSPKEAPNEDPHFNTSDSSFLLTMEQLVSNDKTIRENSAMKAKKYLHQSY